MAWILLIVAGVFEVVWAYYMKQSGGFTRVLPSVITIATMIVTMRIGYVRRTQVGERWTTWPSWPRVRCASSASPR